MLPGILLGVLVRITSEMSPGCPQTKYYWNLIKIILRSLNIFQQEILQSSSRDSLGYSCGDFPMNCSNHCSQNSFKNLARITSEIPPENSSVNPPEILSGIPSGILP